MEIISPDQLSTFSFLDIGSRKRIERVAYKQKFNAMNVNDAMLVKKDEWVYKSSPSSFLGHYLSVEKTGKLFTTRTLADKTGWVVFRIQ